jgi:Invasion associated locus B (IalB) protein
MIGYSRFLVLGVFAAATLVATQAGADSGPTLLGSNKNWSALQSVSRDGKSCYAMSQPKSSEPKNAKRDPIYFLINSWPARPAKDEVEVVSGYEFKADSTVTVTVGKDKFELFTKNDGDSGNAWMKDVGEEARLVDAMKRGSTAVVTGTSARGTATHDTYALGGISGALDKAHAACGM